MFNGKKFKMYAILFQKFNKVRCNGSYATKNLKCNKLFTQALPENLEEIAHKPKIKYTTTASEPYSISYTG